MVLESEEDQWDFKKQQLKPCHRADMPVSAHSCCVWLVLAMQVCGASCPSISSVVLDDDGDRGGVDSYVARANTISGEQFERFNIWMVCTPPLRHRAPPQAAIFLGSTGEGKSSPTGICYSCPLLHPSLLHDLHAHSPYFFTCHLPSWMAVKS